MATPGQLIVGVDVGGTNTDAVLLDTSKNGSEAVLASYKAPTTANVTLSVRETLKVLLATSPVDRANVSAIAIGTTHFINAILERDAARLEKVAILRLASYNFSASTPPCVDWPQDLKNIIHGYSALIPGGCNIDGQLIADIDDDRVREQADIIKAKGLKNVVVVGIGSPVDHHHHQEQRVRNILQESFESSQHKVNIVCSRDVAGMGLLARENAAILNASIMSFAQRTIRSLQIALKHVGLQCPLYLTSNTGHLLPLSEASRFPIKIFSSGATNSIRGAAFLVGSNIEQAGIVVVDIGGTSTDAGLLLKNGYPRLARSYSDVAGIKVNMEIPSVESIALGGGSILHFASDESQISIGPQSVGHDIAEKALCFGGTTTTATDVVVASGSVSLGKQTVNLSDKVIHGAKARIKKMLEAVIDRSKLSPDPCTVILVGGGAILCPERLSGVSKIIVPEHAGVANAIGAAMAQISASSELIWEGSDVQVGIDRVKVEAVERAIKKGGTGANITVLNVESAGVPYTQGQTAIKVEVAMPADHARLRQETHMCSEDDLEDVEEGLFEETKRHELPRSDEIPGTVDLQNYRPRVTKDGLWYLSETDIRFLEIGCYILGSGGGGSPYAGALVLRQLLSEGETVTIVSCDDLKEEDVIPSVAGIGTPAVGNEKPGGDGVIHALDLMAEHLKVRFTHLLACEIGGGNGLTPLLCGSSRYYNIPTVDGDLMGRAYPAFEMVSTYVNSGSVNALLPVTLSDGTGQNIVILGDRTDEAAPGKEIRDACVAMGLACGAAGVPLSGRQMQAAGIPNSYSLAWRIGRVVSVAKQSSSLSALPEALIEEVGGRRSAKRLFQGKIRSVESVLTSTAHSLGKVTIEAISEDEMEFGTDRASDYAAVVVPFMNENLAVIGRDDEGREDVLAIVPELIFLLDVSTGENIGTQEYRYGLKVTVMSMAPHPVWTSNPGLEVGGPKAFNLPYEYSLSLEYTKPRSVIDEFRSEAIDE
ncbi:hydantoinase [Cladophialophora carrionii]|uniref:Hydantoinase n=1 Tax=Cladophialophora carrionii TaxID=86049 RepID=A0A1C1CHN4_9EURO|nr:hydantoinase [Cladophialophora carrionii]